MKEQYEQHLNPHNLDTNTRLKLRTKWEISNNNFNIWIKKETGISHWYVPNPSVAQNQDVSQVNYLDREHRRKIFQDRVGTNAKWRNIVSCMSDSERASGIKNGLTRVISASWIHDPKSLRLSISSITDNPDIQLTEENTFKRTSEFKIESISRESLDLLEKIRKQDQLVYQVASDLGLISNLTSEVEDELFEGAVSKLGFKFS
jgi:hypothetical protein